MKKDQQIKKELMELFDTSESVQSLPEERREQMRTTLLGFDPTQMLSIIDILKGEKNKMGDLKKKLNDYDAKITELMSKVKQAGKDLKMAFLELQESEDSETVEKENEALLASLDNE